MCSSRQFRGFFRLLAGFSRCKHPYFYYDRAGCGFMGVRLQARFQFGVQIAPGGREWPRRSMEKEGVELVGHGDKFPHLGDYERARHPPDVRADTRRVETPAGFLPAVSPSMAQALGPGLSHCWMPWQSEWATDRAFESPAAPRPLAGGLLRQAIVAGTCESVSRHMGRPVDTGGLPHPKADTEVLTRASTWHKGVCTRHRADKNGVKPMRDHGLIRKMPNRRKYTLPEKGRRLRG